MAKSKSKKPAARAASKKAAKKTSPARKARARIHRAPQA